MTLMSRQFTKTPADENKIRLLQRFWVFFTVLGDLPHVQPPNGAEVSLPVILGAPF